MLMEFVFLYMAAISSKFCSYRFHNEDQSSQEDTDSGTYSLHQHTLHAHMGYWHSRQQLQNIRIV